MNDEKWLSVLEVEKETKIPNATIRRYIRNHGHHLNMRKRGKSYFISADGVEVVNEIRNLYEQGKNLEQVEESLINAGIPMTVTVNEDGHGMSVNAGEALQKLQKSVNEQNEIIQSLVDQLQSQQIYIDKKLNERDMKLMQTMKEIQEGKKQIAAGEDTQDDNFKEGNKKGWIARLFGK